MARRRKTVHVGLTLATAAAAVTVPLAVLATGGAPAGVTTAPRFPASEPAGVAFRVAPPPMLIIGGEYLPRRTCTPAEIHGTASLQPAQGGDLGVVTVYATGCDIHLGPITPTLLDADRRSLGVPVVSDSDHANAAMFNGWVPPRSFGFAWDGSWCGPPARYIQVPLTDGSLTLPLTGSPPACFGGSHSRIVPGVKGYPNTPVQAAPPEWDSLRVQVHVAPVTTGPALQDFQLTFANSTHQPIALNPVPTFCVGIHDGYGDGTDCQAFQPLPVPSGTPVVPAHGTWQANLPPQSISDSWQNLRTHTLTVTFAVAGIPTATTTTVMDSSAGG